MPLVIDEVVISIKVTNQDSNESNTTPTSAEERHAIVEACVEQVLEILKRKRER